MRTPATNATPEKQRERFLRTLADSCNVSASAQAAGVDRVTVYRWRDNEPDFKQAWDSALEDALDAIEGALYTRACDKDTVAAIFLLKSRRREIFGERQTIDQNVNGGVTINLPSRWALPEPAAMPEPPSDAR